MERYKIMLRKGSKKDFCPDCKRLSFKPYVWADTGEVINPNLGHCDHENSCGHFDKPQAVKDYIKSGNIDASQHKEIEVKDLPTYVFPTDVLERLSQNPLTDNFTTGIRNIFGSRADEVFKEYSVVNTGMEKFHRTETQQGKNTNEANDTYKELAFNGSVGFVYLDKSDRCRGVKIMLYNKDLHRAKYKNGNGIVNWLHKWNDTTNKTLINLDTNKFHECYYGENLLKQGNYKVVGIVESEKTALIGRICCPDTLFIAVGGDKKVKYDKLADLGLQREKVIFYADAPKEAEKPPKNQIKTWADFVETWQKLAPNWRVSKVAKEYLKDGQDIADLLLIDTGFADKLNNEFKNLFPDTAPTEAEKPTEKKDNFLKAWDWLASRYDLQFDTMQQIPQYKLKGVERWQNLTDERISVFYSLLLKADCKIPKTLIYDLFASDEVARVHPLKDYFNNLAIYNPDTEADYITQLFAHIKDIENKPDKLILCKKFFVGIVKTLFDDKFVPQLMAVFRGKPNSGKSTFVKYLCPDALFDKYFCETPPENSKDLNIALTENLFIFFDELEHYSKNDISFMKGLITKQSVKERKPYGHFAQPTQRIATMLGACNDALIFNDDTGNRKYLLIEANEINFDYKQIKIADCYREAMYLSKTNFDCAPTRKEVSKIIAENDHYRNRSAEEELINRYFEKLTEDEKNDYYKGIRTDYIFLVRAVDITEFLSNHAERLKVIPNNVGKKLSNLEFTRARKSDGVYYLVKCKERYLQLFTDYLSSKQLLE